MSRPAEQFTDRTALSHRIREELERVRASETASLDALDRLRQARVRLEGLVWELGQEEDAVRAVVREELEAAGWSRSGAGTARPGLEPGGRDGAANLRAAAERSLGIEEEGAAELTPGRRWLRPQGEGPGERRGTVAGAAGTAAAVAPLPRLPKPPSKVAGDSGRNASRAGATTEIHLPGRTTVPPLGPSAAPSELPDGVAPAGRTSRARNTRIAVVLLALCGALGIGWLAYRAMPDDFQAPVVVGDQVGAPAVVVPPPAPVAEPEEEAEPAGLAIPADAAARVVLYDSLWNAHSPLFDPLLTSLRDASDHRDVRGAIDDWRAGEPLSVDQADQLHSALVQQILRAEINPRIELDGAILRNPCRGTSCSALLNLWQTGRERYGLSEVPEEAPTATAELRQVEAALVLSRLIPGSPAQAEAQP